MCTRLGFAALLLLCTACNRDLPPVGEVSYANGGLTRTCAPGERAGSAGPTDSLKTSRGVHFNVRAPANYDATFAHPLLVVYAPAGYNAARTEHYAQLTTHATRAGFVVAFPDHLPLAKKSFEALGEVSRAVTAQWCIDRDKIYFAGHSDGGTTTAAVTFLRTANPSPRSILVSGAGIRDQDLAQYTCPAPLSVTVVHSREDELFPLPAYGSGAAKWWAQCNGCATTKSVRRDGCIEYPSCAQSVITRYCEVTGAHRHWAASGEHILRWLKVSSASKRSE